MIPHEKLMRKLSVHMITVLYVDDEPQLLDIAKEFLERTGNFLIDTATSVPEAKKRLESVKYDAILSDYQMPVEDGIQFLKFVRGHIGSIPFILFTGRGREEIVIQALENGADFYIQKGGDPKSQFAELRNKIEKAVRVKTAIRAQMESEQRLTDIINFLPDATLVIDARGNVIAWNRAMEQMTGVPASDILGKGNYEYALPFYHERRPVLLDLILSYDIAFAQTYENVRQEGDALISEKFIPDICGGKGAYLWFVASPLYDAQGNTVGAIESIRDITGHKKLEQSARTNEQRYHNVFNAAAEAMIVVDRDSGTILDANLAAVQLYGYTRSEFRSLQSRNLTEDGERMIQPGREGILYIPDRQHRKKENTLFPAEISGNVYPQKQRAIAIFTVRDVTERKKSEQELARRNDELYAANEQLAATMEELRQNCEELGNNHCQLVQTNDFLTSLISASPFAIIALDSGGTILRWNPAAERMFGWPEHETIGKTLPHVPAEEVSDFEAAIRRALLGESVSGIELRRKKKDGSTIDIRLFAGPIYCNKGTISGVIGIIEDITEQKIAAETLAENQRVLDTLMHNLPGMVYRCKNDPSWTMEFVSGGSMSLTGYAPDDLIDNRTVSYASLILPEDRSRVEAEVQQGVNSLCPFQMEYRITDRANRVRWVWEQGRGIFNARGELVFLEGYITDDSGHKHAEEALRQANRKLNFLSGITRHDIRNQLQVLQAYIQMGEDAIDSSVTLAELFSKELRIVKSIEHQIEFTRDYQDLGIQAPVWQNVAAIIHHIIATHLLGGIVIQFDREDLEIYADPLFEKVMYNLLDNALRYGGDQLTAITVSSCENNGSLIIAITDDGAGIRAEDKPQLFIKGFGKNTGLGLFLSREILSITGITIAETGVPGKGARFEITVPGGEYRFSRP
jgi:PAS domain S-box-containing protein